MKTAKKNHVIVNTENVSPDFRWAIRGLYYTLFSALLVILVVLLIFLIFIVRKSGWDESLTTLNNPYNFSLLGVCLLFYFLDRFCVNKKTIYLKNNTLYYATQKKGIICEFPQKEIKAIWIKPIGIKRTNYGLFIRTKSGTTRIKLTWAWVWNVWKLEKRIKRMRQQNNIREY